MNNERFERFKAKHPNWSDEQIWTAVSLDMAQDTTIEEKGGDIDPNDADIWKEIVSQAKDWIKEVLPQVFEKVKALFDNIIHQISEWVKKNIPVIMEKIKDFIGSWMKKA